MTATTPSVQEPAPRALSVKEGRALLDARAQEWLGMTGNEFRRAYERGELDPDDDNVLRVSMLLPFGR